MDQQKPDVPAVVARRRRKTARQLRESTPDPTRDGEGYASQSQASDDQSGSEGKGSLSSGGSGVKKSFIERAMDYGSHRNKILARKDKKLTIVTPRSRSVPREAEAESVPSSPEIFSLLRRAKKSLTGSRSKPKTDDSSDGGKVSDTEVRKRRERIERYQSERVKKAPTAEGGGDSHLQANLSRFNEERRKFELEKLKFLQEKRELDRMRLRRFEKYREELLEEQRKKLQVELANREREERSKSIEAPVLPPVPPTRSKTPVSPGPTKKLLLVVPKTSSASASSSEDEGHNTSDEEKMATIRRRFSPRKPKRPKSGKMEPVKQLPRTPDLATSPEPESELPSDFPPEMEEPTSPEVVVEAVVEQMVVPEIVEEMVLTQRKVVKQDLNEKKDDKEEEKKADAGTDSKDEKKEDSKELAVVDEKRIEGPKGKKRRRALLIYVEKDGDQFQWIVV